ncbi:MAG: exopolysaccharide biosynthesis polyprenyl glycosylphosphotransferase, partial [Propionibacteriaceae bacterium]|nr:exopolysaccharide biosynthesis polyprenyl glycosylphosphotransferase [Propionibacteriaceae bacterium]
AIIVVCFIVTIALTLFLARTKMGKAMRAVANNKYAASLMGVTGSRIHPRPFPGLTLMEVDLPRFSGVQQFAKRMLDVVFSSIALILLSPLLAAIAIAIKCDSKGPAVFRQQRIGLNGEPFTIHKFRTMRVDAEAQIDALIAANGGSALRFKLREDPRVTRLGAFLRRTSLDELLQFWDVLRGPMSVVGPRPQVSREVAEYDDVMHRRLLVKPGITGLWQVNGRSDLSPAQSKLLDIFYVENWSVSEDVVIIGKTVKVLLDREGAY